MTETTCSTSKMGKTENLPETVQRMTLITDWDWNEDSRPELLIDDDVKSALLKVPGHESIEISGSGSDPSLCLRQQLSGYRDIFTKALETFK